MQQMFTHSTSSYQPQHSRCLPENPAQIGRVAPEGARVVTNASPCQRTINTCRMRCPINWAPKHLQIHKDKKREGNLDTSDCIQCWSESEKHKD